MVNRFHDFPEDILREILEVAAHDGGELNWACALVSKKVQGWVERILYEDIVVTSGYKMLKLHRTQLNHPSKPPRFFQTVVKGLHFDRKQASFPEACDIVSACTSVVRLTVNVGSLTEFSHGMDGNLQPKRIHLPILMLLVRRDLELSFTSPRSPGTLRAVFQNVTHLELDRTFFMKDMSWETFSLLPSLTHFSLSTAESLHHVYVFDSAKRNLVLAAPHFPSALIACIFYIPKFSVLSIARQQAEVNLVALDGRIVVAVDEGYYRTMLELGEKGVWLVRDAIWVAQRGGNNAMHLQDAEEALWRRAEAKISERRQRTKIALS